MNKLIATRLKIKALQVAENFSNPERRYNPTGEYFEIDEIIPFSEHTSAVIFLKNTGKKAIAFFYFIPGKDSWEYFFPTDSHLIGMLEFPKLRIKIESENFEKNFEKDFESGPLFEEEKKQDG